jgi:hypothetical protein
VAWLVRDGDVLAAVEVIDGRRGRYRALNSLAGLEGAVLLRHRPLVLVARCPVDVAYCDRELLVGAITCLSGYRVARPRLRHGSVVVARGGAFERWRLAPGDRVEVKGG